MQNRTSNELFELVKSMTKCEKKRFSRYVKRNTSQDSLKVLTLFKVINAMDCYDEIQLTKKIKGMQRQQLPNLKAYLYVQLLDSLRLCKKDDDVILYLHQLMEHANILVKKGFIVQALKVLKRLKNLSRTYQQVSFLFQGLMIEKKIELVYGGCEEAKIKKLNAEMLACNRQLQLIGHLSNQCMLLYGWYKKIGIIRNKVDENNVNVIWNACAEIDEKNLTFYPKLYLLQAITYTYLLKGKAHLFYQSALDWVSIFNTHSELKAMEILQYHRGLSYLNEAALQANKKDMLLYTTTMLDGADTYYKLLAQLNWCFFEKRFDESLVKEVHSFVKSIPSTERLQCLCYKAARICFNAKAFDEVLNFTIIALNQKSNDRADLQYALRLLQIETHDRLGNGTLSEDLSVSTRRFAKLHQLVI